MTIKIVISQLPCATQERRRSSPRILLDARLAACVNVLPGAFAATTVERGAIGPPMSASLVVKSSRELIGLRIGAVLDKEALLRGPGSCSRFPVVEGKRTT